MTGARPRTFVNANGVLMNQCPDPKCVAAFDTVTGLNIHEERAHGTHNAYAFMGMLSATAEDKAAARRILGLPEWQDPGPNEMPRAAGFPTPQGSFRNGKSPERRAPDRVDSRGYREWKVASESSPGKGYDVIERHDTSKGGTYFFCSCPSWPMMRGKGRDCKHIKEVIA